MIFRVHYEIYDDKGRLLVKSSQDHDCAAPAEAEAKVRGLPISAGSSLRILKTKRVKG